MQEDDFVLDEDEAAAAPVDQDVTDEDEQDDDTEQSPAIDPPSSWRDTEKVKFAELPPEAQEVIARRERDRDVDIRHRQDDLARERKALAAEMDQLNKERQALAEKAGLFEHALQPPDEDLNDPDSEKYDPDEYRRRLKSFNKNKTTLDALKKDHHAAVEKQVAAFRDEQIDIYRAEFPEFLDQKKGPELHQNLLKFAMEHFNADQEEAVLALRNTTAKQMMILRDAMKYRELRDVRKKAVKPQQRTTRPGSTAKAAKSLDAADILYG